jgi:hypothetical protein
MATAAPVKKVIFSPSAGLLSRTSAVSRILPRRAARKPWRSVLHCCCAAQVLVPIAAGSEPVEASVPVDILRRAGAEVTVASAAGDSSLLVEVMHGVKIVADALVADCADASYDLVVLPVRHTTRKLRSIRPASHVVACSTFWLT